MTDGRPLTADTVASLAARLGIETTPERTGQIRDEIAGGLDGYARLLDDSDEWAPARDRDLAVTHDPGEDVDPYNAFISLFELSYTLDHVGPLAPDVRTAARVLDAIADSPDETFLGRVEEPPSVGSLTVGVPAEFFGEHVSETVDRAVRDRLDAMAAAGATVRNVSLPLFDDAVAMWNAVTNVEFATFLGAGGTPLFRRGSVDPWWHRRAVAGIDDPARSFGDVVQRKAIEGAYLLAAEGADHYVAARNGCRALAAQFESALADCDVLVTPTMPSEPIERGTWSPHSYSSAGGDATPPLAVNTRPANLAGLPALTVPAAEPGADPIGVQFVGSTGEDATVLAAGAAFERLVAG